MSLEEILSKHKLTVAQKKVIRILYNSKEPLTPRQIREEAGFCSCKTVYINLKSLVDLDLVCPAGYTPSEYSGRPPKLYVLCDEFMSAVEA